MVGHGMPDVDVNDAELICKLSPRIYRGCKGPNAERGLAADVDILISTRRRKRERIVMQSLLAVSYSRIFWQIRSVQVNGADV